MGKPIEISGATVVDDTLLLDTDRSITGQDGAAYDSAAAAGDDPSFPGRLAARIFESVSGVTHVFVASNQTVIRRSGGWDDASRSAAADAVSRFFVFYPEG